jgi:hypothetical protein
MDEMRTFTTFKTKKATKIQKWWKRTTNMLEFRRVLSHLNEKLTPEILQDISNKCNAITRDCKGDGAGLTGGGLIDKLLSSFFQKELSEYSDTHEGESDITVCGIPLSIKKITGPSELALDWSKNAETSKKREHFSCHIMIINLNGAQWWKQGPKIPLSSLKITYNDTMPSGIYLIDRNFCKIQLTLSTNNKTNTLIKKEYVYIMMKRSLALKSFIRLPPPNKVLVFDILNAFQNSA